MGKTKLLSRNQSASKSVGKQLTKKSSKNKAELAKGTKIQNVKHGKNKYVLENLAVEIESSLDDIRKLSNTQEQLAVIFDKEYEKSVRVQEKQNQLLKKQTLKNKIGNDLESALDMLSNL
ncbi:hypothetical protein BC833DRAFT_613285 [Globomyces pollinis-pini]|nr:hypothetical protein BC833DRAFT_613285 [Globomyces pollinis-pini]